MTIRDLTPVSGGFQTKQALVAATLRQAIQAGELAPGERLVIDDIAEVLQVSPIPVREALRALQQEGLIVMRPHAGAVVAGMDKEAIRELFALMESLELVAVRAAVPRVDPAAIKGLSEEAARMRVAAGADDHDAWAEANRAFHRRIVAIAGLPLVAEFTERVLTQWDRLRRMAFRDAAFDHGAADNEHDAIIAAFTAGDAAALETLVVAHNRGALEAYLGRVKH
jgi:DNA-binding GntR family transcriptional regulator